MVTQDQINEWIEKHGDIHEIVVAVEPTKFDPHLLQDDDLANVPTVSCFIKTPDDRVKNFALQNIAKPQDAGAIIIKNCWLGGDERIRTDKGLLGSASLQALEFIEIHQAKVKKHSKTGRN